jgi:fatty acid desaturase
MAMQTDPHPTDAAPPLEEPPAFDPRVTARKTLEQKRRFRMDVVSYLVINAFLIGIWAFTGAGYFWPGWVLAGWGVALLLDAWQTYFQHPVTELDVEREVERQQRTMT